MLYRSDLLRVEISRGALLHNLAQLRRIAGPARLAAVVKANAYGHGLCEVAGLSGAAVDWFMVHSVDEVAALRAAGHRHPVLVLSYVQRADLEQALTLDSDLMVADLEQACAIAATAQRLGRRARVHLKIESGTHRLGVMPEQLPELADFAAGSPQLELVGAYTHFANIEDTTDHSYARLQEQRFDQALDQLARRGIRPPLRHTACSAAAMLFPSTRRDLVRAGIALYGLWPSRETLVSLRAVPDRAPELSLRPVMRACTRVAQVKQVPAGAYIGYGCTYRTTRPTTLAILPVGYFDGFDRRLSNVGHVLLHGQRAPVRGRVSMNLTIVDVTDIPGVAAEDEAVLLGPQGEEHVSAEQLAAWCDTINYEVVTRLAPFAPRVVVD